MRIESAVRLLIEFKKKLKDLTHLGKYYGRAHFYFMWKNGDRIFCGAESSLFCGKGASSNLSPTSSFSVKGTVVKH